MRYTIVALAASSLASAQTVASPSASATPIIIGQIVPVGSVCTPGGTPCALGAQCYATNSGLQTVCGNFQAACTSNQQCAFNTCNQGLCNGFLSSSSQASASPTPSPSPIGQIVPVGSNCTPGGTPCALGAQCYATNSGLQTVCGNFQAACTSNQQCAFNTCNQGFCNGFLSSSSRASVSTPMMPSSSSMMSSVRPSVSSNGTAPVQTPTVTPPAGSATRSGGSSATGTSSPPQFTGAASVLNAAGGAMAMVLGAFAFAL